MPGETSILLLALVAVSAVAFVAARRFAPRLLPIVLVGIAVLIPVGIMAWLILMFSGYQG